MASPITSSTGLGSGLNITEIVTALVKADTSAKQAQITRQTSNNTAMISGIGSLRSALTAFQDAMKALNDKDAPSFNAYAATSANESVVKIKSSNSAVAGSYDIVVDKLATGSKVASQQFSGGATSPITAGQLTISQNGKTYNLDVPSGATLQSVRDQINKEMSANGISANIINEEGGSRLVLGSTTTGAGTDLSLSGIAELAIDGTTQMSGTGAGFITAKAQDAELTIDGLKVKSASNTLDSAISGMTLELTGVSPRASGAPGTPTAVTVAADNDGLKKSVQSFVDAYNTLQKAITSLTSTSRDSDDKLVLGPLTNDPTTRSLLGDIRKVLSEVGAGDQLTTLSQLGINTQKDGTLEFNSSKFSSAMNDKKLGPEVQELFTGTDGIFERMNNAIDPYNKTDGSLATRKSNLDKAVSELANQQAALDRRTESLTESLTKKYVALDAALGKMKAQADQITSIFEAINAQAKKS
ncbi:MULTISPECIES: flagellar filament capping protein FliD [Pseudomonas]|jgi:flagellar hook-associated protein 2|uniref:Flagellar hook-associated protein 2 n=1 Tax=Pseudomonas monteilii TaxID=76759 RepID=A0A2N1INI3_9PSED|nr:MULTISPECIES: flagellar filament capping protein FliD [Pseudomonas]EKT4457870.1 flagellar filament capping protein FliD [Pseudomonas putida]EKT4471535.1 flagellar filament capping protein FliD [Pseudomonas putida]EKT4495279.1 flagellar filament capping protein FliD [Pseudomonas putida]EKT4513608.1 flagellar filament capping protein FliD [Pseudomonas putida]EKT4530193.1 flagellar filament capping protein FliD [Pseudomonas putida]